MRCRRHVAVSVSLGLLAAACGGGGSSPATPTSAPTPAPLTISAVAPSLAQEIGTGLAAALRSGLGIASRQGLQSQAAFLGSCHSGGTVGISTGFSTPGGGRVVLSNSPVNYSNCSYSFNGRNVTLNGTLTGQGTWTASDPNNPVTLAGSLDVNEIGPVQVSCASLSTEAGCNGTVGGIRTGPADTPPPPNPTPTPTPSCGQFDGNYRGGFSGALTYMGNTAPVGGDVVFSVSGCVINVSQPGSGSGSVSSSGSAGFSGRLTVQGLDSPLNCSFTGTFVPQGGGVGASGGWSCSGQASGSGGWSASRN